MNYVRPLLITALVGLVLLPSPALSGGWGGSVVVVAPRGSVVVVRPSPVFIHPGPHVFVQARSVFPVVVDPWRFWGVSAFPRPFFRPVVTSVPVVGGVYTSAVYAAPPITYSQPAPVAVPVPAPVPIPTLIEHPAGWYQLRGDGVTSAYVWVWIPKPPPSPPSDAPPTAPPGPPSHTPPTTPEQQQSPAPHSKLYRWADEQDVVHWTDRLDRVPDRYRARLQSVS